MTDTANNYENAGDRDSFIGDIFDLGIMQRKREVLDSLPLEWKELHQEGAIHIHDLEAYGETYNCLAFDVSKNFPYRLFKDITANRIIPRVFNYLKELLAKLGNEQSGGMAFANFDDDVSSVLMNLGIETSSENVEQIACEIYEFLLWCNDFRVRFGKGSFYITLNIGLASSELARMIATCLIDEFQNVGPLIYKPNIVFKIKKGINFRSSDCNYDLLEKALVCTSKKMIPTYLFCDAIHNKDFDPRTLAIMGCRTRVAQNLFETKGAVGRGNIAYISINLPRLAFSVSSNEELTATEKFDLVCKEWKKIADIVSLILLDRFRRLLTKDPKNFSVNYEKDFWCEKFSSAKKLEHIFSNGTLSLGFIGLSEMIEILFGMKYYEDDLVYEYAKKFVEIMRAYCEDLTKKNGLNFSLLATSGEMISGRFMQLDKLRWSHSCLEKCFYTNSFHINVDSGISAFDKIKKEGPFHPIANGGSITYVEFREAPLGNSEALHELVECASQSNVGYLGFNFPIDTCSSCSQIGVFDSCPNCNSEDIKRIRRVSGYLEILDFFTYGKKAEVHKRKNN